MSISESQELWKTPRNPGAVWSIQKSPTWAPATAPEGRGSLEDPLWFSQPYGDILDSLEYTRYNWEGEFPLWWDEVPL